MPDSVSVDDYINCIITNAERFIRMILKPLERIKYEEGMRAAVAVLWSA